MFWVSFVNEHPILSSMLQFAVLGTVGEILGMYVRTRKLSMKWYILLGKAAIWAVLAVMIKYAFTGFGGFVAALVEHQMLPEYGTPFFISAFMNIMFGPIMIASHRLLDNLLERKWNWLGMKGALLTLVWFWIPAHTVTFMLPSDFRITLAAVWSVVLGIIMGFFKKKNDSLK